LKAVIDRFKGQFAVILFSEEKIRADIPWQLLLAGAREGSWLKVSFGVDPERTEKQEEKIRELLEELKSKNRQ